MFAWRPPPRFLASLLAAAALLAAPTARADIPVFIGFMDEEVKTILKHLIELQPPREVLVIEREDYKDLVEGGRRRVAGSNGLLFQTPMAYYTKSAASVLKVSTQTDPAGNKELAHRLAAAIKSRVTKNLGAIQSKLAAFVPNKTWGKPDKAAVGGAPTFTVLAFNAGKADHSLAPIVLLRSPEMGLQPDLAIYFFELMYEAISTLDPKGALQLSVYGGSGGAWDPAGDHSVKPARPMHLKASLFVGFTKVGAKYVPVIRFSDGKVNVEVWRDKDHTFDKPADVDPSKLDNATAHAILLLRVGGPHPGSPWMKTKIGKGDLAAALTSGRGKVSLSASNFVGQEQKAAAASSPYNLVTVDMEDYAVLAAAANSAAVAPSVHGRNVAIKFEDLDLLRYDCDPSRIESHDIDMVFGWAAKKTYSVADYADAIVWGMDGALRENMPASATWKGDGLILRPDLVFLESGKTVDPFYAEIASDFLQDTIDKDVFGRPENNFGGIVPWQIQRELNPATLAELVKLLSAKADVLSQMAKAAKEAHARNRSASKLNAAVQALMTEAAFLDVPAHAPLHAPLLATLKKCGADCGNKLQLFEKSSKLRLLAASGTEPGKPLRLEVWLRSGKWAFGKQAKTLDYLTLKEDAPGHLTELINSAKMSPAQRTTSNVIVDRALYKSGAVLIPQSTSGSEASARSRVLREAARLHLTDARQPKTSPVTSSPPAAGPRPARRPAGRTNPAGAGSRP